MTGSITIADKVITETARHLLQNNDGVAALTDRSGRTRRGRAVITRDRKLVVYVLCRRGANTNRIYNETADGLRRIFGDMGNIRGIVMHVTGVGE